MTNQNEEAVRRFEEEFKNRANLGAVDELMTSDFVHHLPYPGLPPGPRGMKAVGKLVTGAIRNIHVTVDLMVANGDLVADRVPGSGVRVDDGEPISWVENHIYRVPGRPHHGAVARRRPRSRPTGHLSGLAILANRPSTPPATDRSHPCRSTRPRTTR